MTGYENFGFPRTLRDKRRGTRNRVAPIKTTAMEIKLGESETHDPSFIVGASCQTDVGLRVRDERVQWVPQIEQQYVELVGSRWTRRRFIVALGFLYER